MTEQHEQDAAGASGRLAHALDRRLHVTIDAA